MTRKAKTFQSPAMLNRRHLYKLMNALMGKLQFLSSQMESNIHPELVCLKIHKVPLISAALQGSCSFTCSPLGKLIAHHCYRDYSVKRITCRLEH